MSAGSSVGLPGRFSRASATRHDIANPVYVALRGVVCLSTRRGRGLCLP